MRLEFSGALAHNSWGLSSTRHPKTRLYKKKCAIESKFSRWAIPCRLCRPTTKTMVKTNDTMVGHWSSSVEKSPSVRNILIEEVLPLSPIVERLFRGKTCRKIVTIAGSIGHTKQPLGYIGYVLGYRGCCVSEASVSGDNTLFNPLTNDVKAI